jgi:hypothetical protein
MNRREKFITNINGKNKQINKLFKVANADEPIKFEV